MSLQYAVPFRTWGPHMQVGRRKSSRPNHNLLVAATSCNLAPFLRLFMQPESDRDADAGRRIRLPWIITTPWRRRRRCTSAQDSGARSTRGSGTSGRISSASSRPRLRLRRRRRRRRGAAMSAGRRPPPRTSTPPASPVINQKHHLIESFGALISLIDTKRGMVGLGVRKEEIRVEVEDAMYLVIRTELDDGGDGDGGGGGGRRSFARKFRLPAMVDADGISAEYTHGVLRVTVPRLHTRARPVVNLAAGGGGGGGPACDPVARAA